MIPPNSRGDHHIWCNTPKLFPKSFNDVSIFLVWHYRWVPQKQLYEAFYNKEHAWECINTKELHYNPYIFHCIFQNISEYDYDTNDYKEMLPIVDYITTEKGNCPSLWTTGIQIKPYIAAAKHEMITLEGTSGRKDRQVLVKVFNT